MKLHKIPGIDKNICACEQKVAYNYAFMWRDSLEKYINQILQKL